MRFLYFLLLFTLMLIGCDNNSDDEPIGLQVNSIDSDGTAFNLVFLNLNEDPATITTTSFVIEDLGSIEDPEGTSGTIQGISSVTTSQEFDGTHSQITLSSQLQPSHVYRLTHYGIFDFENNLLITPPLEFSTPETFTEPDPDPDPDPNALTLTLVDIQNGNTTTAIPGTTVLAKVSNGSNFTDPMTATFNPADGLTVGPVTVISATTLQFPLQITPDGFGGLNDDIDTLSLDAHTLTLTDSSSNAQTITNALTPTFGSTPQIILGSPLTPQTVNDTFLVPVNAILTGLQNESGENDELRRITVEVSFDPAVLSVALTGGSGDAGTGLIVGTIAPFDEPFFFNELRDTPPAGNFSSFQFTPVLNTLTLPNVVNLATIEFTVLSNAPIGDSQFSITVISAIGTSLETIDPTTFGTRTGLVKVE